MAALPGGRAVAPSVIAGGSRVERSAWEGLGFGFRVWGLGFRVWGLGFRVWGLGFRVRVSNLGLGGCR